MAIRVNCPYSAMTYLLKYTFGPFTFIYVNNI